MGKHILVIWAYCGQVRPYKAPVFLSKDNREYAYYIRKGSSTVRATQQVIPTEKHDGVHDEAFTATDWTILSQILLPKSTPELLSGLGYERRTRNYESSINKLLEMNLIERTIPEKPRSKKQKYRITEKGRSIIKGRIL